MEREDIMGNELSCEKLLPLPAILLVMAAISILVFEWMYNHSWQIAPQALNIVADLALVPGIVALIVLGFIGLVYLPDKCQPRQHLGIWVLVVLGIICAFLTVWAIFASGLPNNAWGEALISAREIQSVPNWYTILGLSFAVGIICMLSVLIWLMYMELKGRPKDPNPEKKNT
jgi:amino acid transporter